MRTIESVRESTGELFILIRKYRGQIIKANKKICQKGQ